MDEYQPLRNISPVHGEFAVRVVNWALSFCASRPFWSLNPPLVAALAIFSEAETLVAGETLAGGEAPPLPTPGFCVRSTNCVPSAMGPPGLAGHDPRGFSGPVWPRGMVPGWPRAIPPTKRLGLAPLNWH